MNTRQRFHWNISLFTTLAMILLIAAVSFIISDRINQAEKKRSIEILCNEQESLVKEIEAHVENDHRLLDMLSTIASKFSDMQDPKLWEVLDSYDTVGMMSDLALILPDDTVVLSSSKTIKGNTELSFKDIAAKGYHISGRGTSLITGGYILRHYVPVVQDGETMAMLYGVVDLQTVPERLTFSAYVGKTSVYIIDGETGDFLLDTWHSDEKLGNFWDMGNRTLAKGYDDAKFKEELFGGKKGHVVFFSNSANTYLYYYYSTIDVNRWILALSVPSDVVFSNANMIRGMLNIFLVFEGICFLFYFLWMFHYVRQETGNKQRQVDTINNVYEIARLLLGAHENQDNIGHALKRIASNSRSSAALFWVAGIGENGMSFVWDADEERFIKSENKVAGCISYLLKQFALGKQYIETYDTSGLDVIFQDGRPDDMMSMAAIPLGDVNGELCGILAIKNPQKKNDICSMLRSVSFSFSMLCRNLYSYSIIKQQGDTDVLTGLFNRNRYERNLLEYKSWYNESLACIYIDTNGLHDVNNSLGHEAGDLMLKRTSEEIVRYFGNNYSYRIGGDEFVVFVPDMPYDDIMDRCRKMENVLESEDIYISVGVNRAHEIADMGAFIRDAEEKMYSEKDRYYEGRHYRR